MDKFLLKLPKKYVLKYFSEELINEYFDMNEEEVVVNLVEEKFKSLVESNFENDPSMIVFFTGDNLTFVKVLSAMKRGFVATEDDLLFNPQLGSFSQIMEPAIKNKPHLIKYTKDECYLSSSVISDALSRYTITVEDLKRNPDLCKNSFIMSYYPEYRLYCADLSEKDKKAEIIKCLGKGESISVDNLPFLDTRFGSRVDVNKLSELVLLFNINIDEEDVYSQQEYFDILSNLIDSVVNIRYKKNKNNFKYSDIVTLNDRMVRIFEMIKDDNVSNNPWLIKYIKDLYFFIGKRLSVEFLTEKMLKFYDIYKRNGVIDLSVTGEFCNMILNYHRNGYMSRTKDRLLEDLKSKMDLSIKRKNKILIDKKLGKIRQYISNDLFGSFGTSREEYLDILRRVKIDVLNNKKVKRKEIKGEDFDFLISVALNLGYVDDKIVSEVLHIDDEEVVRYIVRKLEQVKMEFISNVTLSDEESKISDYDKNLASGLNSTNYLIADRSRYFKNIAEILLKLDEQKVRRILNNKEYINEILFLLPIVNLIPELDVATYINILINYDRIRSRIIVANNVKDLDDVRKIVLSRIDDLISLANAYNSVDDITLYALGKDVVSELDEGKSDKYLNFYLKMYNRKSGLIPPVSLKFGNFDLESGVYSDPERLLIGRKVRGYSCIDLDSAGKVAYTEVLSRVFGDVILVRNNHNLVSRILLFRRGNIVQMTTKNGDYFPIDMFKKIANQIMEQAKSNGDNIDYIFVNSIACPGIEQDVYSDPGFREYYPHADLNNTAILLASSSGVSDDIYDKLNFTALIKSSYRSVRKKISFKPTESDLMRIRALDVFLEEDPKIRESKARNFEPIYMDEYQRVICGEDWYIALKKDGTYEELILPSNDDRTCEEFLQVKEEILNLNNNRNKR